LKQDNSGVQPEYGFQLKSQYGIPDAAIITPPRKVLLP
jgi:hypothetical protein